MNDRTKYFLRNIEARIFPLSMIMILFLVSLTATLIINPFIDNNVSAATFGNTGNGDDTLYINLENYAFIYGVRFNCTESGVAHNISVRFAGVAQTHNYQCALYNYTDYGTDFAGGLISKTAITQVTDTDDNSWIVFNFNESDRPNLVNGEKYYIVVDSVGYISGTNRLFATLR